MTSIRRLWLILCAYARTRYFPCKDTESLRTQQATALARHFDWLSAQSPYWRNRLGTSSVPALERLAQLPVVEKSSWLDSFDASNTVGLTLADARAVALKAESDRDFSPTIKGVTVGLSSGTSGTRGVFVVSPEEQATWAGTVLGQLLPKGLLGGARIAFFLRASSNLYTAVRSRRIEFQFFDLLEDFEGHTAVLEHFRPTVIVAPAQVLQALAAHPRASSWKDSWAVSVAEVLEPAARAQLENQFYGIKEVYQATEGLLAMSCDHGRLHLNEHIFVEKEYLDATRFVPVITDMARKAQPLVRYRLNDVLRESSERCSCGRASTVIEAVEGRCDDQLTLPCLSTGRQVAVFADAISRVLAQALPMTADYELIQHGDTQLTLKSTSSVSSLPPAGVALSNLFAKYNIDVEKLSWTYKADCVFPWQPHVKRRRIRRVKTVAGTDILSVYP